jgi:hypothetical protein
MDHIYMDNNTERTITKQVLIAASFLEAFKFLVWKERLRSNASIAASLRDLRL